MHSRILEGYFTLWKIIILKNQFRVIKKNRRIESDVSLNFVLKLLC